VRTGLELTAMRDPVSWGFYIGNFTFLVGVAAAAVVLVIPAYHLRLEAHPRDRDLRRAAGHQRDYDVSDVRHGGYRPPGPLLAPHSAHRSPEFPPLHPGVGRAGTQPLFLCLNFVVATHILYRAFHGKRYIKKAGGAAGACCPFRWPWDPHGDGVSV